MRRAWLVTSLLRTRPAGCTAVPFAAWSKVIQSPSPQGSAISRQRALSPQSETFLNAWRMVREVWAREDNPKPTGKTTQVTFPPCYSCKAYWQLKEKEYLPWWPLEAADPVLSEEMSNNELPPFSSGSVSTPKERPLGCKQQSTEARAQEDPLLCPQMFCFVFSGGRGLVLILGSRKQSLPCFLIYENRGTGIIESIFNLTRITGSDHWIHRRLPSLSLKALFLWSKGATTITRSSLSVTVIIRAMTVKFLIRKQNPAPSWDICVRHGTKCKLNLWQEAPPNWERRFAGILLWAVTNILWSGAFPAPPGPPPNSVVLWKPPAVSLVLPFFQGHCLRPAKRSCPLLFHYMKTASQCSK